MRFDALIFVGRPAIYKFIELIISRLMYSFRALQLVVNVLINYFKSIIFKIDNFNSTILGMDQHKLPELNFNDNNDTYQILHLWSQIIGKIKLAKMPWINHSWHVTLTITPTGLTTGPIPHDDIYFEIELSFIEHHLLLFTSKGQKQHFDLMNLSVKTCYHQVLKTLEDFGIIVKINPYPSELENPLPFDECAHIDTYNPEHSLALHQAILFANNVFTTFRSEYRGKVSPVHLYWGAYDLAVTRFSGREAPKHPGGIPNLADWVTQEAYSHEVSSCGFWPGNSSFLEAAFYAYFYPSPVSFADADIEPNEGYYHKELGEFILTYDAVRNAVDPAAYLLSFLRSTYQAGAKLANWDMKNLAFEKPKSK